MSFSKNAPIAISILIILTVAYLRNRSRTFAVLAGTMPVNLPLTLWITFAGSNADSSTISGFVRSLFLAMIATMLWVAIVWLATHYGWGLLPAVMGGYFAWGIFVVILINMGYLSVKS